MIPRMASTLPVDAVGVSHVAGKYNFTEEDFLSEGADTLHELGCRVIKLWFTNPKRSYPFNSNWPDFKSLVEMAKSPYYQKVFEKPFDTIILEALSPARPDDYFRKGMTADDVAHERAELAELTAYLLDTYRDSRKTFVLQNWEGDWAIRGGAPGEDPSPKAVKGMIEWFNARQDGVDDARKRAGDRGMRVLHAAEVNHVVRAMKGEGITLTNDVLPHTHCDLYSYSAYDVATHEPDRFRAALDYLASKAPGEDNVYVGEYGAPENEVGGPEEQDRRIRSATETALAWGAKYVVYWQLYCNEPKNKAALKGRPENKDMKGFWLIRPVGSRSPVADYFIDLWNRR
jgi:hypothetical protein